ncbi:ribbon-helix-helix protein, CopG family [Sinorhizobium meliloti]|nr:ribbon-helix-helix protein, CopG family [Sinorhizobium meliloti]
MASQTVVPKKKRGPAPTGKGTQIQVRLHDDLLAPLDAFVADQEGKPSRAEAIRTIIRDWLISNGYIRLP